MDRAQRKVTLPIPQQDNEMSLFFSPVRLRTVSLGAGVMWIPSALRSVLTYLLHILPVMSILLLPFCS